MALSRVPGLSAYVAIDVVMDVNSEAGMQVEVLTGAERRRRWSSEQKAQIVAEAEAVGVAQAARRHEIWRQNIYQWRRALREGGDAGTGHLIPVDLVSGEAPAPSSTSVPMVEIDLRSGRRLRLPADLPSEVVARLVRVVEAA